MIQTPVLNLEKLFKMQQVLDDRIMKKKGLTEEGIFKRKKIALFVEFGETLQEWRGFKYWSKDQEPRNGGECDCDDGYIDVYTSDGVIQQDICPRCKGAGKLPNTLLEEFVDGLHFFLSFGNYFGVPYEHDIVLEDSNIEDQILTIIALLTRMNGAMDWWIVFGYYRGLAIMLGLDWEDVVNAYYKKNEINHKRQDSGY